MTEKSPHIKNTKSVVDTVVPNITKKIANEIVKNNKLMQSRRFQEIFCVSKKNDSNNKNIYPEAIKKNKAIPMPLMKFPVKL